MNIVASRLLESMHSQRHVTGMTHNFYKYPARFSPELAREVIGQFSNPNDWVFDPFMGGGTTIVEALALGRLGLGIDLNSLAWFVSIVKTTPLSQSDHFTLREWALNLSESKNALGESDSFKEEIKHIPPPLTNYIKGLLKQAETLQYPRLERFARCAILRACQRLIDGRNALPSLSSIEKEIRVEIDQMLNGLDEFVTACQESHVLKNQISSRRILLQKSTIGIETDESLINLSKKPRLVFTSPPYPGVHVLYHRWQVSGRKETSIPYLICGSPNGRTESFYTFGGRRTSSTHLYFELISRAFRSIAKVIYRDAIVVQLVGFSEIDLQLPFFLKAMENAGYEEIFPVLDLGHHLWREVPNRKWYTKNRDRWDSSKEVLLFHRIKK
ncbi:MAG: DNA methyltransferase [Chloroflexota bacterium]